MQLVMLIMPLPCKALLPLSLSTSQKSSSMMVQKFTYEWIIKPNLLVLKAKTAHFPASESLEITLEESRELPRVLPRGLPRSREPTELQPAPGEPFKTAVDLPVISTLAYLGRAAG